jgi:predicted  nucleic acid-binding Zn-ribbon protein
MQKVNDAENRLARQRQSLDDDVQMKQKQFSELRAQLEEQHLEVARKLQQVEVGLSKFLLKDKLF